MASFEATLRLAFRVGAVLGVFFLGLVSAHPELAILRVFLLDFASLVIQIGVGMVTIVSWFAYLSGWSLPVPAFRRQVVRKTVSGSEGPSSSSERAFQESPTRDEVVVVIGVMFGLLLFIFAITFSSLPLWYRPLLIFVAITMIAAFTFVLLRTRTARDDSQSPLLPESTASASQTLRTLHIVMYAGGLLGLLMMILATTVYQLALTYRDIVLVVGSFLVLLSTFALAWDMI